MPIHEMLTPKSHWYSITVPVITQFNNWQLTGKDTFGASSEIEGTQKKVASYALKLFVMTPILTMCAIADLLLWTLKTITIIGVLKTGAKEHFSELISILALPILGFGIALVGESPGFLLKDKINMNHEIDLPEEKETNPSNELLISFYQGIGPDIEGRNIKLIWSWNDALKEKHHDYIQWLFPLPESSDLMMKPLY